MENCILQFKISSVQREKHFFSECKKNINILIFYIAFLRHCNRRLNKKLQLIMNQLNIKRTIDLIIKKSLKKSWKIMENCILLFCISSVRREKHIFSERNKNIFMKIFYISRSRNCNKRLKKKWQKIMHQLNIKQIINMMIKFHKIIIKNAAKL